MKRRDVIVFLGPSLSRAEARSLVRADYRPPARQGDVFRALADEPRVIVLIDGVFESQPSVWHHELLAAHASGVHVLGASSMGADRAAELPGVVIPVGIIAEKFCTGVWNDDAYVALHHADASQGYRALTVPWVNLWATAERAVSSGVLSAAKARRWIEAGSKIFYQDRTWTKLVAVLSEARRDPVPLQRWVRQNVVDLKAHDARLCLAQVSNLGPRRAPQPFRASSFVRRRRAFDVHGARLAALARRPDADALAEAGVRRLLLADLARICRIEPDEALRSRWLRTLSRKSFAADERATMAAVLALEEQVLSLPERFVPDGPSRDEGLYLEAKLRGLL
jgi:hypothetical protein